MLSPYMQIQDPRPAHPWLRHQRPVPADQVRGSACPGSHPRTVHAPFLFEAFKAGGRSARYEEGKLWDILQDFNTQSYANWGMIIRRIILLYSQFSYYQDMNTIIVVVLKLKTNYNYICSKCADTIWRNADSILTLKSLQHTMIRCYSTFIC